MSNINHDPELPDDDFIEEEVAQAKPGMSPLKKMLIGSAAAIAVVGGLMISVGGSLAWLRTICARRLKPRGGGRACVMR